MARLNPVPGLLGLSIVVCVVGCMSLPQADFSRDGRTVVVTGGDGIVFHDAAAKRPDVTVKLDDAGSPAFSPDGSLVAVQQNISEKPQAVPANSMPVFAKPPVQSLRTLIVGRDGRIKFRVSNLGGPYAWRPDGTELLGCDGDIAKVVYIPAQAVARTYRLPFSPNQAVWMGAGRDVAFTTSLPLIQTDRAILGVLHRGVTKALQLEGEVLAMRYDARQDRLVWVEEREPPNVKDYAKGDITVMACDPSLQHQRTLLRWTPDKDLLCSATKYVFPTSVAVTSDGKRLAVAGWIDTSRPGLMERYEALGGFDQSRLKGARLKAVQELENQRRIGAVCASMLLEGGPGKPTRCFEQDVTKHGDFPIVGFCPDAGDKLELLVAGKVDKIYALWQASLTRHLKTQTTSALGDTPMRPSELQAIGQGSRFCSWDRPRHGNKPGKCTRR